MLLSTSAPARRRHCPVLGRDVPGHGGGGQGVIEPPRVTTIVVTRARSRRARQETTFPAKGLDQHQRDIDTGVVNWTATGSAIDASGVFGAGQDEGGFVVTATVGGVSGTASVTISKPGVKPPITPPPPKTKERVTQLPGKATSRARSG